MIIAQTLSKITISSIVNTFLHNSTTPLHAVLFCPVLHHLQAFSEGGHRCIIFFCHLDLKYRTPNVNTELISWANKYSRRRPENRTKAPTTAKKEQTLKNWIVSMCQTHEKILINLKVKL